jgi:hypothetical protein
VVKAEHIGDSQDTQPENTNGAIDEAQEKEMI